MATDNNTATAKAPKPKRTINKQRMLVAFNDQDNIIRDYIKKFVGSTPNGRVSALNEGRINKMLDGNIGVNRLIYLALYELETNLDSGDLDRDGIINILKDSGFGLF